MAGVEVKAIGPHHEVFGVGGFQYQQPAGLEYSKRLPYQLLQNREGDMFGNVEPRHQHLAGVGQRSKLGNGVGIFNVITLDPALLQHAVIQVYANRIEALPDQYTQPLATATAQVNRTMLVIQCQQRMKERQIHLQPLGDQFRGATVAVLESAIERFFHRMHSTAVGTHAMPTNWGFEVLTTLNTNARSRHS